MTDDDDEWMDGVTRSRSAPTNQSPYAIELRSCSFVRLFVRLFVRSLFVCSFVRLFVRSFVCCRVDVVVTVAAVCRLSFVVCRLLCGVWCCSCLRNVDNAVVVLGRPPIVVLVVVVVVGVVLLVALEGWFSILRCSRSRLTV